MITFEKALWELSYLQGTINGVIRAIKRNKETFGTNDAILLKVMIEILEKAEDDAKTQANLRFDSTGGSA